MANVPNLRFNYAGNWTINTLDEICDFYKGNGLSKSDLSSEGRPCILYGELYTSYKKEIIDSIISKTDTMLSKPFISQKNDVIIPGSGEDPIDIAVARAIENDGIILGGDLNVLRLHPKYSGAFLSYQLNGKRRYEIAKKAQGKSIVHLHNSDLKGIKVFMPQYDEQLKIINLLKRIDKRIELQNKIIEDYKKLKKQIIDSIFSTTDTSWAKCSFKDIFKERKELHINDGTIVHATLSKEGIYPKTDRYDRDFLVKDEDKKYKVSYLNDICYNPANLKFGVITRNDYGKCIVSPIYVTYFVNPSYNPKFIELFVTRAAFLKEIRRYEQGTVYERMAVSSDDFLTYETRLPNVEIQNDIVESIDILDKKITQEQKYLELLAKQKDYLLSNMFI